ILVFDPMKIGADVGAELERTTSAFVIGRVARHQFSQSPTDMILRGDVPVAVFVAFDGCVQQMAQGARLLTRPPSGRGGNRAGVLAQDQRLWVDQSAAAFFAGGPHPDW